MGEFDSVEGNPTVPVAFLCCRFDYEADRSILESLQYGVGGKSRVELYRIREGLSLVVACPDRYVVAIQAVFSQCAGKEDAISVVTLSLGGVAYH